MRPLNRPMFRYGGPIKEGIMDGMKEPQAVNTVGSPLAPTDASGRQGYALPLLAPIAFNVARTALMPLGRLAMQKALRSGLIRGPGGTVRGGLGKFRPETAADMGAKLSFTPNKFGRYFTQSPEAKFLTGAGGAASKFVGGALKGLKRSPLGLTVTAGTLTDILPGGKPFGPDKFLPNILNSQDSF